MEIKKHIDGVKMGFVVVMILSTAVIFLSIGYYAAAKSASCEVAPGVSSTPTATASATAGTSATATADVTANWKTYTNETYGFSFKYPADWRLKELDGVDHGTPIASVASPESVKAQQGFENGDKNYGPTQDDVSVSYFKTVADEEENKSNNFGATTLEELISKNTLITKIGSITLGTNPATDVIRGGEGAYYTILSVKNNHLYQLMFNNTADKQSLTSTEKSIINSFRFTK